MRRASEFDLPLSILRQEIAAAPLLPKPYARYQPLLADALHFFLERLSSSRLEAIFSEQMQLPPSTSAPRRIVALFSRIPALHKLGQVLARDRRLSKRFRHRLQQLESLVPTSSSTPIEHLLGCQFPKLEKAGIRLDSKALAEGSVAVILPFVWQDARKIQEGVFKVLKPDVEAQLEEDLAILVKFAGFLDERCSQYHLPKLEYQDTFETIKELLLHEVRFENEQKNLIEATRLYSGNNNVVVPAVLPFCSARVTAMERLRGWHLPSGRRLPNTFAPEPWASLTLEALVATPIFSSQVAPVFHGDPHAGNLLLMPNGRLGLLDWSLTGRLPRRERAAIIQLMLAALTLDPARMKLALRTLAKNKPHLSSTSHLMISSLREVRWGSLPGIDWLTRLLDDLVWSAGVRFSDNLMLFRKSLLTLEGVVADLARSGPGTARTTMNATVTASFLNHWLGELPCHFFIPFRARSPTTHLSTEDLLSVALSGAATSTRWWTQTSLEFAASLAPLKAGQGE